MDDILRRSLLSQKTVSSTFLGILIVCLNLGKNWSFPVTAFASSGLFGGHTVLIRFMCSLPSRFFDKSFGVLKSFNQFYRPPKSILVFKTGAAILIWLCHCELFERGAKACPTSGPTPVPQCTSTFFVFYLSVKFRLFLF